ncbi:MAG: hypothetical protein AB7W59_00140 [Acidimicrobiia bacterium]
MKGVIRPDHIPVNKYELRVIGAPTLVLTEVSGIEDELETTDLPDRTVASGGNRKSVEFTIMQPMHHGPEVAYMETWYRESQDPVAPSYKKAGTLLHSSLSGITTRGYQLVGLFPSKRKLPDLEMENEGEIALIEWTMKADDILPL